MPMLPLFGAAPDVTGQALGAFTFTGTANGVVTGFGIPQNLVANAISSTEIDLTWDAVLHATGYDIERDAVVIVLDHGTNSYSDTGLTASTEYDYRVRAVG